MPWMPWRLSKQKRTFRGLWIARINAGARLQRNVPFKIYGKIESQQYRIEPKGPADLAMNHQKLLKPLQTSKVEAKSLSTTNLFR